jgi:hypothetical protein
MRRARLNILGFCLCLLLALLCFWSGCNVHDYVPKSDHLLQSGSSKPFIINDTALQGVYGNMDVPCEVFTYKTTLNEAAFWAALDASVTQDGYTLTQDNQSERSYRKVIPKSGKQRYHSIIESRVAYRPQSKTAIVATIPAETRDLPDKFPDDSVPGRFAAERVWPKFDELVNQHE